MKHPDPAIKSLFFRRLVFFSVFFSVLSFAHAQCPTPYPIGDLDTTLRNVPVATVVTANDIESFGSPNHLVPGTLTVTTAPAHGTTAVLNDSTIVYTPFTGYTGVDFYTYTVCNTCGNCAQGSVTISIAYYCPAPVPVTDNYTVYNDRPQTLPVTNNDINVAGGPLTVTLRRAPLHGTAMVSGADFTFTGDGTYVGADTLSYVVCDSCAGTANCDTGYVHLRVVACTRPDAITDLSSLPQGGTVTVDLTQNDAAATGFGTTTVTLLNGSTLSGTATLTGHTLRYRASSLIFGTDTIRYQVCTDCGCDTGLAIFTVTQAPCARPTIFADNLYAGYSVNCSGTYDILSNDAIPPGGGASVVTIVTPPGFGTATIVNNKLVYTCTDSTRAGQVDAVTYSLCNSCLCDTGIIAIRITNYPCNGRNPVVNKDTAYVCNNYSVSLVVTGNDIDPEGTVVTVDTIVGSAQHGTARKVNGTTVSYTPLPGFSGHDFFVYRACDAGTPKLCNIATVDVFVSDCNSAPVILNRAGNATDTVTVVLYEDSFATYCFQYQQADSPYVYIAHIGTALDTIRPTPGSTTLGTTPCVTITAPYQYRFGEQVQFILCNAYPLCDTVTMLINVIQINHRPHAFPDVLPYSTTPCVNVIANDIEDDINDHMTISSFDTLTHHGGTVTQSGDSTLCYTPSSAFAGMDTFYYTICDTSHTCATSYVVLTVGLTARPDQAQTMQDQPVHIDVRANDSHTADQYITLCGAPLHGNAVIDSGQVVYTPDHNYPIDPINPDTTITAGVDSFCYTLCSVFGTDTTCINSSVVVTIAAKGRFFIPQGISPNGDGVNDKFVIPAVEELPKSQLLIFNRYGDEVWRNETDGYQNDFDGTWKKNGQPLPDSSYWYIFKYNDGLHADRMGFIIIER